MISPLRDPIWRYRILNGLVGTLGVILTELGRVYYRPYIYAQGIDDFHIADTLGNSVGVIAAIFVMLAIFGRRQAFDRGLIIVLTPGFMAYECLSPLLGLPIDPWDVLATLIAGGISYGLHRLIHGPMPPSMAKTEGHPRPVDLPQGRV